MVNINNIWQKDPFVLRGAGGESVPKLQSSLLSIFLVQIFHKFRTLVIGWMVLLAARFAGGAQIVLSTWVFFKFRRHVRWNWVIIRIIIWQIFTIYQSANWQRCPDIRDRWWMVMFGWWWWLPTGGGLPTGASVPASTSLSLQPLLSSNFSSVNLVVALAAQIY